MAKLSLREIKQSQLDAAPVVDGQLVFCTDTGNLYRDVGSARMRAGSDIEIVSELPLAPIEGKVYCLRDGDMWLYEGGDWLKLNSKFAPISHTHTKNQITDFPSSMPASDVSAWAKAASKPSYTKAEVGLGNVDNTADSAKSVKAATKLQTYKQGSTTETYGDSYPLYAQWSGNDVILKCDNYTVWTGRASVSDSANAVAWDKVTGKPSTYTPASHTHNYAGSASAGGSATSAVKLDTSTAGSATQPVYFSGGKPVATTYTLGKSVPADAVFTDTVYSHPTSSGNKHIPSGGSAGQFLKWSADGTAVWAADNNTTYNNATQSSAGLMSSTDKKKLDSVDMANACMYDGTSTDISEMQSTCDYIDGGAY